MRIPLLEKNDVYEFKPLLAEIEERPVSPMGRSIMIMIIVTILFFGLWSYFGQIDIVVTARGVVIADGQNKVVQPLETGVVSKIFVKEGDLVQKGQALMEIDPSTTQPELHSVDENLRYSQLEMQRLNATLGNAGFLPDYKHNTPSAIETQRSLYEASLAGLQKDLSSREAELRSIDAQLEQSRIEQNENVALLQVARQKDERLNQVADIVAKEDLEKLKNEILSYENNISQESQKQAELTHQQSKIKEDTEKIRQDFKEKNLRDLGDKQKQSTELHAKLQELTFKNSKQMIVAPVDGHVDQLFMHTVGGVVTPAEKLLSIVPTKTPLVIKANVHNQDIGFVEKNQEVAIKVDTFEFQKYGMYQGKVKLISKDSHEDEQKKEQEKLFDVYVSPTTQFLMVEGRKEFLKPGMTVTAEVKVGKRRIIEFFVYPIIKYWQEGMSVR